MAEQGLPDLVARIRLVFDGDKATADAKRATAAIEGKLNRRPGLTAGESSFADHAGIRQGPVGPKTKAALAARVAEETKLAAAAAKSEAAVRRAEASRAASAGARRAAVAIGGLAAAYTVASRALKDYLAAGASGAYQGTAQQKTYEETAASLASLAEGYNKARAAAIAFVAANVNPFNSDFKKGLAQLQELVSNPLAVNRESALRRRFAAVDAESESKRAKFRAKQNQARDHETYIRNIKAEGAAEEYLAKARERSVDLADAQARATRGVAEANDDLADAHRRVKDAAFDVADAEEDLAEAQFRQGSGSEEAIKAGRALERAKLGLGDAQAGVADAGRAIAESNVALIDANAQLAANVFILNETMQRLLPGIAKGVATDTTNVLSGVPQTVITINADRDADDIADKLNRELDWAGRSGGRVDTGNVLGGGSRRSGGRGRI